MISWFKYPFVRLLVPFSIGIYLAFSIQTIVIEKNVVCHLLIFLLILLISLILVSVFFKNYRFRWVFPVLLFLYLILLGFSFVKIKEYNLYINDISKIENIPRCYFARLCECPSVKDKTIKVMLDVFAFAEEDSVKNVDS